MLGAYPRKSGIYLTLTDLVHIHRGKIATLFLADLLPEETKKGRGRGYTWNP